MSRPTISPGSQQSRSGYTPAGAPQQIQRQLQDETTITIRPYQPGSASAQTQDAWLDTRNAEGVHDVQDTWDGDGAIDEDTERDDEQRAWNRALGAVSAINTQIRELCSQTEISVTDLTLMFKALKSARASSQLSLLSSGGEDKMLPALGAGLIRLVTQLSHALGDEQQVTAFDTGAIAVVSDGLRAALGMRKSDSLFTTAQLARLKQPMRFVTDALMQRSLDCGLPAEQKSNYELLAILKLLSRGLKLRFTTEDGQSDTLLSKHSGPIGEVFWNSLLVIRDWPPNPEEKGGNQSYVGTLDTRQLGVIMVQINTLPKQQLRDLDEEVEDGLTCGQLLAQCALKLCGGNALDEFRLWSRPNTSPFMEKTAPALSHAPVSTVVVANISNTIKDFFETSIISLASPALPAINSKLLRWMKAALQSGDAAPDSQGFSNFANFLRAIAETGLRGLPLPVQDVAEFDDVCRLFLDACTQIRPSSSADEGDIQHFANLVSFVKSMARRDKHEGYLYRRAAASLVKAMAPHAGNVRQAESFSGLLAGSVYFMQSGVLPVQAVQPLVESLLTNCTALVKPYWQASMRKQVLQAIVGWLSDARVQQFGDVSHTIVPPMLDAIFTCRKPDDEPLPYLKALQLIAQRYPAQLGSYLPLLSAITARTVMLADAVSVIAQAISSIGDEPAVAAIAVEELPPPPAPKPVAVIEPVRPGSLNWQPVGGVLAEPAATSGGDGGKAGNLRLANRKKHRQAKRERMRASEPVAKVRNTATSGVPTTTQETSGTTRHIMANHTSNVVTNITARPVAASSTTNVQPSSNSSATTRFSTTYMKKTTPITSIAATATGTAGVTASTNKANNAKAGAGGDDKAKGKANDKANDKAKDKLNIGSPRDNADKAGNKNINTKGSNQSAGAKSPGKASVSTTSTTNLPKTPQVKGTPREQWQFHFTKSKDDSTQGLDALLSREPALLMQKTGSGAAAQPALFHAISRGQPEKLSWLITQLEERGIMLDIATIFPMLDRVFDSATLVGDAHKQALQRFIAACERQVPEWQGAFAAYLKEQGAMIPVGFGLTMAPASASSADTGRSARMTWRGRERYKEELRSARQLKNELDAEMLQLTGGRAPTMEDWQTYSAVTAAQLLKKGNVDGSLLIEPDGDGDIQIMRQVRNGQWKMATSILDAKFTTEQLLARDAHQQNVLMITITKGYAPMVDTLLEVARNQGGDVLLHMVTARDDKGNTPLMLACQAGDPALVKIVLNGGHTAEQLLQGDAGARVFQAAMTRGDPSMANLLMGYAMGLGLRDEFEASLERVET